MSDPHHRTTTPNTSPGAAPRGRLLGVDVGSVRVGVALSDPDATLATPLTTLRRDAGRDSDVAQAARLVTEHAAVGVVVGLPRHLAGVEGAAAAAARSWAGLLRREIGDPQVWIRLVDERLTTVDAHRRLTEAGVAGRRQRERVDRAAAVLILQNALDTLTLAPDRIPAGEPVPSTPPRKPRKPRHRAPQPGASRVARHDEEVR